jgi:hypothetical protein
MPAKHLANAAPAFTTKVFVFGDAAQVKIRERKRTTAMRTNVPISTRELSTVCGEAGAEGGEPEAFALG